MVKISDLNKREREVRKSLNDLEKQLKDKKISNNDYTRLKKEREVELKKIGVDRKMIIDKLPPIPPPPKPTKGIKTDSDIDYIKSLMERQEKDINFTQDEVSKMFAEVVKNREKIKTLESMIKKSTLEKPPAPAVDAKELSSKVDAKVEMITNHMKTNLEKSREDLDRMMGDLRNMKMELDSLKKLNQKLENMDVSGLRRDVESLKQKDKSLEEQVAEMDMEPVYDILREMDRKIANNRGPVIIE